MPDWEHIFKTRGKEFPEPIKELLDFIPDLKKSSVKRILDLGSGSGRHTILLASHGFEVFGLDISKTGLNLTAKVLKENNLKANLINASCYEKFPFEENSFDAVVSTQVIHHNYHEKILFCISEIKRVLKNNGLLFLTVSKEKDKGRSKEVKTVAKNTYIPLDGIEKGLPHYIYTEERLRKDFQSFDIIKLFKTERHFCLIAKN